MAPASFFLSASLLLLELLCSQLHPAQAELDVGYYDDSCPMVEEVVRSGVEEAVGQNPGLAAGLLRIHFHDCFVEGCDASILLDTVPGSGTLAEKDHPINSMTLRGADVIDNIKDRLEQECPETVSCADILAFAARDAVNLLGGPSWPVPAGRLDGMVSLASEVALNLPAPSFNLHQLTQAFADKGFSQEDMVALSDTCAHTIGNAHCNTFAERLYGFNATHSRDPRLDPSLAASLQSTCRRGTDSDLTVVVAMDVPTPSRFDTSYYAGLQHGRGLFSSDDALLFDPATARIVARSAVDETFWFDTFADAMFRMSQIDVKTEEYGEGEIRINCRALNYY